MAYSSVSHMGYLLIVFSLPNNEGYSFGFSYLIIYMISGICFWLVLMLTIIKNNYLKKKNQDLTDLILLQKSNSGMASCLSLVLFSMAGFPPLIGFLVKISLFFSAMEMSYYLVSFISIFCSVISTFFYIRIIKLLYFEGVLIGKLYYPIKNQIILVLLLLVYFLVFFFIRPNLLFYISYKISFAF